MLGVLWWDMIGWRRRLEIDIPAALAIDGKWAAHFGYAVTTIFLLRFDL
jgi:hypothetical protein